MRVVHVVCTANFAGVESHIASLAHQQVMDGDDVTVVGGDPSRMPGAGSYAWLPGTSAPEAAGSLRHVVPNVTHAHMTRAEFTATLLSRHRPIVATRHFARRRAMSTRGLLAPIISSRVDAQISVSKFVADAIETPSVVIPAGVPNQSAIKPAADRDKVILVLQRLEVEKRPLDALKAFHASDLWWDDWRLQFVGGGSMTDEIRTLAAGMGLAAHVDLVGYQEDPAPYLDRARVLLAPCTIEAQGLAVIEAMARALPVVAAGAGGHLESVGSVSGAALYDPAGLTEAGEWLRRIATEDSLADQYGHELQARQRERFNLAAQSRDVRRVYEGVL
ncbi:glycosyltransferase family 4 protein [Ornithinimicrobium ciconiae]|uniref:D-inositol 3-phosphate glycosyltransferase n=1 Tax=Ornithinimicrobium ciconiae TaxID=2594265 RepID=A0A516G7B9_9MICO|nr:glycosyltransferase family 4 protein [Ornithinimicrobium ciconiae]